MQTNIRRFVVCCILFFSLTAISFANQQLIIEPDMGRAPILNAIQQAKSTVEVVMYGLTDTPFIEAFIRANAENKRVTILLQHYPYKAIDENANAIKKLQTAHLYPKWPSDEFALTHQKSLLIDHASAVIMTFNLTHSTFSKERNFALLVTDPTIIHSMDAVFHADWQHTPIAIPDSDLIWSPDNSRAKLLSLLRDAKREIKIYAEGLNDYQIIGSLAKAARSGINVTVLTSTIDNRPLSKAFQYLIKNGVTILYSKDYIIHAKVILIDNRQAVLGSINLTKQSINNNRELAIITRDPEVIAQLHQTFERDCQHATNAPTPINQTSNHAEKRKNVKQWLRVTKKILHLLGSNIGV